MSLLEFKDVARSFPVQRSVMDVLARREQV